MVCRENKARSGTIGYVKHLLRQRGYQEYSDTDLQSLVHEVGHSYGAAPNPSDEEYIAFLKGFRQQVASDESLSEADRFRQSDRQPGIVTRIDQEITRFTTGKDEKGRPLRPEQRNIGRHFAMMQRMYAVAERGQRAKRQYLETYARSMGVTVEDANRRWGQLSARSPEERKNTQISLTDDWRDRLTVAGVTAEQQADLGQSNVQRDTMRVMEAERQAKLRTQPKRPTIRPEQRAQMLSPEEAAEQVRCEGGCGQFGHTADQCPNQAQVEAVEAANSRAMDAGRTAMYDTFAMHAQTRLDMAEASGEELPETVELEGGWSNPPNQDAREWLEQMSQMGDPANAGASAQAYRAALKEAKEAEKALDEARGPIPKVSARAQEVGYDSATGHLEVTERPLRRKTTGEMSSPKVYSYRMSPEEYEQVMASPDPGEAIRSGPGSRRNDAWAYENAAEAREARTATQCATCGQFAPATSGHQCPVPGSFQEAEDAAWRERVRKEREQNKLQSLPVSLATATPRQQVNGLIRGDFAEGGTVRFPDVRQMRQVRGQNKVGLGSFNAQLPGARVSGKVYTWRDPSTGTALFNVSNVKCSCGARAGVCAHVERAKTYMGAHYGATHAGSTRPGGRWFGKPDADAENAQDSWNIDQDRIGYRRISALRAEAHAYVSAHPTLRTAPGYSVDPQTRARKEPPASVTLGDRSVDLTWPNAVREVQAGMGDDYTVSTTRGKGMTIRPRGMPRGAILTERGRAQLASRLGLPTRAVGMGGVYVPPGRGWAAEFMERAHGQSPSILGERFVPATQQMRGPAT